jgi:hypothetical protein
MRDRETRGFAAAWRPTAQARRASAFLAHAEEHPLPDLIVAEVVYALESFHEVERARVAELVRAMRVFGDRRRGRGTTHAPRSTSTSSNASTLPSHISWRT